MADHLPVTRLTPAGRHAMFGYYDVPAFSADGTEHLCHLVPFMDRLPAAGDTATLARICLADGTLTPVADTTAWNFQQGSMLQWHPAAPNDAIIYNRFDGRYVGVVRDLLTGRERVLDQPVATVDPSGRYALSINFSRVFDFRPGYGYAHRPDPWADVAHPADDGVFSIDLEMGVSTLLLPYTDLARALPRFAARKIVVNHITINPDGSRFLMLVRDFRPGGWDTALLTAAADGTDLRVHAEATMASHYHWRDPGHLLIYATLAGVTGLHLLDDATGAVETLDPAFFTFDGHCSFSPNRQWLLYDTYPRDGRRHLYLYDLRRGRAHEVGVFADPYPTDDIRCDLHPRWAPCGTRISFDAVHEGFRGVYLMDVSPLMGEERTC
jgi:hypothetical protein